MESGQDDERALRAGLSLSGLAGAYGETTRTMARPT